MSNQVARPFRTIAVAVLVLVIFFWAFFDMVKKIPFLAVVNPFVDDPYDAVGSFGLQLALFAALLSILRAFRPYSPHGISSHQQLLILRGETVAVLAIIVTLTADLVAMMRYSSMWASSAAGFILAGLLSGLILLTLLISSWLYRVRMNSSVPSAKRSWTSVIFFLISLLLLAVYPVDLLESIPGGIFTALLGMMLLFISTWALATVIFPRVEMNFEDVLDDFQAIYRRLKSRVGALSVLEILATLRGVQRVLDWLNPRKHRWHFVVLIAILLGGSLMLAEVLSEGLSPDRNIVLLVLGIFLGIEGAGIVLGYLLFGEFLGIFRQP